MSWVRKLAILAGMLLLGFCVGGIVSWYSLAWAIYGMGHTWHVCSVVGDVLLVACPALSFATLVLSAMHLNGFLDDDGNAKGPWVSRVQGLAQRVSKKRAAMALLFSIGFLLGPLAAFAGSRLLYAVGQASGLWFVPPLQGWG